MVTGTAAFRFPISITRVRGGGMDRKGNKIPETRETLHLFAFAPGVSTEDNQYREQTDSKAELYGPYAVDLLPNDRVELPAPFGVWEVDGRPSNWGPNPFTGDKPGSVTRLKVQEG